jgi:hypothetical protein
MAGYETFDDFMATEDASESTEQKPFQFRDNPKSEKETLTWLNTNFQHLEQSAQSRIFTYMRFQTLYKGIHWKRFPETSQEHREFDTTERKPRHTVNYIKEMVDGRVAQVSRLSTNVATIPNNDSQQDINNAQACKKLLDSRAQAMDLDTIHDDADFIKFLFGTVFQKVYWDPKEGPLLPSYKRATEKGVKIPQYDENGKRIKGKYIDEEIRMGDVCVENIGPERIFPEKNKKKWKDVDYVHEIDWVHLEELKAKYPNKAHKIHENDRSRLDFEELELSKPKDMVMVRTFYHRKTRFLPEGACIVYTDDVILEDKPYPYKHGKLPYVVDKDIDIYGELWGRSFISQIESMQRFYNTLQSSAAHDYGRAQAPKWMVPKGSVNYKALDNEYKVVEYRGPQPPRLESHNPVGEQLFQLQDRLEGQISKHSNIYDISRGKVPSGVTASSALRFLDEQESQMLRPLEKKRKKRVLDSYRMMSSVMGQYYANEKSSRMVNILGEKNEYMIQSFKQANFEQLYDVRLQNSPELPDTKTGKISAIIDLNAATQKDPIFTKEEIIEMLDLATDERFKSQATVAVTAARSVLEMILSGEEPPAPEPSDDFLVYYSMFTKAMQETVYKTKTPPEVKATMRAYIQALEMHMFQRAKKNLKFLNEVLALSNYPIFFELPMPMNVLAMQLQGQALPAQQSEQSPVDSQEIENIPKNLKEEEGNG